MASDEASRPAGPSTDPRNPLSRIETPYDAGRDSASAEADWSSRTDRHTLVNEPLHRAGTEERGEGKHVRRILSVSALGWAALDLLLMLPTAGFLVFGCMVYLNEGTSVSNDPVPMLKDMGIYSAPFFPIVFSAVVARCLRAIAVWRLERGITVLSLEYLLGSRTVFSAVTTPLTLGTSNWLTPSLLLLWALSPLGGQAISRIFSIVPASMVSPSQFTYLDYSSNILYAGPTDFDTVSLSWAAVNGAFAAALSSPMHSKSAPQDIFNNVKIPMIEACQTSSVSPTSAGWYDVDSGDNVTYSSILGLPVIGTEKSPTFYNFTIATSYMHTDCSVSHQKMQSGLDFGRWQDWILNAPGYTDGRCLLIGQEPQPYQAAGLVLEFYSLTSNALTNATCTVTTTSVEVEVGCLGSACNVTGIRASTANDSPITVLDGDFVAGLPTLPPFLSTCVNASNDPWTYLFENLSLSSSSPIENYFTNPGSPYALKANLTTGWTGADIWPVGDLIFSQRLSQLLNTYWIASIAPIAVTGDFKASPSDYPDYQVQNVTGTITPAHDVVHCNLIWFVILVVACSAMVIASLVAAVLGVLQRGPDVLDRPTSLLRNNRYMQVERMSSMEDSVDVAKQLKDVKVCLGDVRPEQKVGYVAIGRPGSLVPVERLRLGRMYD